MPAAYLATASTSMRFSSSDSSAATRHLPPSFSGMPADVSRAVHAPRFHVSPPMNGRDVAASASGRGLVCLPTSSRSMSTSKRPCETALSCMASFLPFMERRSPWSCLSPRAATTATAARSALRGSTASAARYDIPPPHTSDPPSMPNRHALTTLSLSFSSSGIWWWSSTTQSEPSLSSSSPAMPAPRSAMMWNLPWPDPSDFTVSGPNSFTADTVNDAPALARALASIPPDARPSQSMWVVTDTGVPERTRSATASAKYDSPCSIPADITRAAPPLTCTSSRAVSCPSSCSTPRGGGPLPR